MLGAYLIIAFAPFFFIDDLQMLPFIRENGLYETLAAIAFLLAAVFLGLAYWSTSGNGNDFGKFTTRKNVFILGLALILFIGAGEELSWGQHMFGFEPPDAVAKYNRQRELNIHNLVAFGRRNADGSVKTGLSLWLTVDRLYSLFWLGFCVCVPLLAATSSRGRRFLQCVNMPIVPLWIGMAFPLNYILAKIVVQLTGANDHFVTEVMEANFAVMFCLFGVGLYVDLKRRSLDSV